MRGLAGPPPAQSPYAYPQPPPQSYPLNPAGPPQPQPQPTPEMTEMQLATQYQQRCELDLLRVSHVCAVC